jgi:glycosyltransferase involved in cell wall biosynthesis
MPFLLAHGGAQIQIEQTQTALNAIGVQAEPLRWWDANQQGDLIHFFGRPSAIQIRLAHKKGMKVVIAELLTAQGSRKPAQLRLQKLISRAVESVAPSSFTAAFNWDSYRNADGMVANTAWEKHLMEYLFDANPARTYVVPNGVEEVFFTSPTTTRGEWLVCTTTITERKRVLELAQAAVAARTPVWIIGRPYAEDEPHAQQFFALARQYHQFIRYEGGISDRIRLAEIYRAARGFVLLSAMETRSLSAEEAAACECPLLLSDLPWAHSTFGATATYCPVANTTVTATALRKFHDAAPGLPRPNKPATWQEVARQFKSVFERVLAA